PSSGSRMPFIIHFRCAKDEIFLDKATTHAQGDNTMDIAGNTVIVVGGSSGMGFEVARAALTKGAEVLIVGRSQQRLAQAAEALAGAERVRAVAVDVTREDEVSRF